MKEIINGADFTTSAHIAQNNMKTHEKLEASRKIRPTEFHPKHLSEMKLYGYIGKVGLCINNRMTFDLFDSVHFVKSTGTTTHAMGVIGTKTTYLILKK